MLELFLGGQLGAVTVHSFQGCNGEVVKFGDMLPVQRPKPKSVVIGHIWQLKQDQIRNLNGPTWLFVVISVIDACWVQVCF